MAFYYIADIAIANFAIAIDFIKDIISEHSIYSMLRAQVRAAVSCAGSYSYPALNTAAATHVHLSPRHELNIVHNLYNYNIFNTTKISYRYII